MPNQLSTIIAAFICVLVFCINNFAPASFIEKYYLHGFFQWIRFGYHYTLRFLPFATSYIFFALAFYGVYRWIRNINKSIKAKAWGTLLRILLSPMMVIYLLFYLLWGFNYKCSDVYTRLQLKYQEIDTMYVYQEVIDLNRKLDSLRAIMSVDTHALDKKLRPHDIIHLINASQKPLLQTWHYPYRFDAVVRSWRPSGSLLIWSTAGIYNPFSFEGQYDAGLSHLHSTFVIAHEMGHFHGITDEGDCNFLALMTCIHSKEVYINYTGLLTYWRYLMADLHSKAPTLFLLAKQNRSIGVKNDILAIYACLDHYPDLLPRFREYVYDFYLKSNGVKQGVQSYNRVIAMVAAYESKYGALTY